MTTGKKEKSRADTELDVLAERVAEFIQYWGFKRIHGKIWTHLFLSDVPLDATTLVKRIGVSKALVSFSIHDLLEYKVIREVARGRGRTVLYDANPDITGVILDVLRLREKKLMTEVKSALRSLEKADASSVEAMKISPAKVKNLAEMVDTGQQLLDFLISAGPQNRDMFNMLRASFPDEN